jgi:hypothetical protein
MMRPPPGGMPTHSERASASQTERIASARRGSIGGIGESGATVGVTAAGDAAAAGAAGPPLTATTAVLQAGESDAALLCRHCNASAPPGCTPEQCDMKSERHADPMALVCDAVGLAGTAAVAGGGAAAVGAAGSVPPPVSAVGEEPLPIAATAFRHFVESLAALRCRQASASAPPGCTPEQFAMKSDRHAERMALVCLAVGFSVVVGAAAVRVGSGFFAGAGSLAGAAGDVAAAGAGDGVAAGSAGDNAGVAAAGAVAAAGVSVFGATALTAVLHAADNLLSFCSKHSNASFPPGWTLEQCAMKSDRHAERMALRCASVGCCAVAMLTVRPTKKAANKDDLNMRMPFTFHAYCDGRIFSGAENAWPHTRSPASTM